MHGGGPGFESPRLHPTGTQTQTSRIPALVRGVRYHEDGMGPWIHRTWRSNPGGGGVMTGIFMCVTASFLVVMSKSLNSPWATGIGLGHALRHACADGLIWRQVRKLERRRGRVVLCGVERGVRSTKMSARWMPWRLRPMKDVATRRKALGSGWQRGDPGVSEWGNPSRQL